MIAGAPGAAVLSEVGVDSCAQPGSTIDFVAAERFLTPNLANIPAELRAQPRWVMWRGEGEPGTKPRKVPYRADLPNSRASSTDPDTWCSFSQAETAHEEGDWSGVGFVLNNDGIVGVDIDGCRNPDTEEIDPRATALLEDLGAGYVEVSPSGTGLRAFGLGPTLATGCAGIYNGLKVELYSTGRYMTLTGVTIKAGPIVALVGFGELAKAIRADRGKSDEARETERTESLPGDGLVTTGPREYASPHTVTELRSALNRLDADDYHVWIANGNRLAGLGATGRELWMTWGAQSPKFDPAQAAAKWCTFAPSSTGYAAVFSAAQAAGWVNPASNAAQLASPGPAPVRDRSEAIARARAMLLPATEQRKAPEYPVAALGPLAAACSAIAEAGQVQPAMVGQCLLGASSLLTQGLFNVETLTGWRPLSLYLLTLGDSGDGKSTAQDVALRTVHAWQRSVAKVYAADLSAHESAMATRKKGEQLPETPASPYRLVADATVEGLRRDLANGPCAQGVFTDEAAAIVSGYGMSADHRSKTAGTFSKLWDEGHLSVARAVGPRVELYGRRVAAHWLIQPMAAAESIGDPLLAALGFWPRFLLAWPDPQAPRLARRFRPDTLPDVGRYWARCEELLATPLPEDAGDCPVITLDDDARELLGRAFEQFEVVGRQGMLQVVKPFALRATEQACRVAGVLAAFDGRRTVTIDDMGGALALVGYSLEVWRAVIDGGVADQGAAHALRLYEWLTNKPDWQDALAVIVNRGPLCVRSKDKRDAALALLEQHGLVERVGKVAVALMPAAPEAKA